METVKFKLNEKNNNNNETQILNEKPKVRAKNTEKLELFKNIEK